LIAAEIDVISYKGRDRMPSDLVKSKQRVADHGEVFTPAWMVEAMLDLVKDETERIASLNPPAGAGIS
jgi:hypothetical protein